MPISQMGKLRLALGTEDPLPPHRPTLHPLFPSPLVLCQAGVWQGTASFPEREAGGRLGEGEAVQTPGFGVFSPSAPERSSEAGQGEPGEMRNTLSPQL